MRYTPLIMKSVLIAILSFAICVLGSALIHFFFDLEENILKNILYVFLIGSVTILPFYLIINGIIAVLMIKFQLRKQVFWRIFVLLFFILSILYLVSYFKGLNIGKEYNFYFILLIVMLFFDGLFLIKKAK